MGLFYYNYDLMILKPALSIEEQINQLQHRGMIINDVCSVENFLLNNNYYRLNIYFHKFMDRQDKFRKGTSFNQITGAYINDRWFRNTLLIVLEPLEIKIKTQTAYILGEKYGSDCFYQKNIYKNVSNFIKICNTFENEKNRNNNDPVVRHHNKSYAGQFPIWVIVEYISFNTISRLFSNLLEKDKKEIAQQFNVNEKYLSGWLHTLCILRNICAHYGYLFKRAFSVKPKLYKEFKWDDNSTLFSMCLIINKISERQDWHQFIEKLSDRERGDSSFLYPYGFPKDWRRFLT